MAGAVSDVTAPGAATLPSWWIWLLIALLLVCCWASGWALHHSRSEETEVAHPGTEPTEDTAVAARKNFAVGAKLLLYLLDQ
jgi:hypothetical protein